MYNIGGPLAGGGIIAGTLAHTGLDVYGYTAAAVGVLISGLLLLRYATVRRHHADQQ